MSPKSYSAEVLEDLKRLALLADARSSETRLRELAETLDRWRDGKTGASEALQAVREFPLGSSSPWTTGSDPGMPVAQAVVTGILTREDLPEATWASIEVLVTLAEL